ncbi:protein translocase subunit SecF, partial [Desulfobacteraceae bacterium SEEP-SAG9]
MQFIKPDINVNFLGKRKVAFYISLAMILVSFASVSI